MSDKKPIESMFDIKAPPPFEQDGVRFVFFAGSQKVAESLDNLPAFSFEVASVTPGVGSVSWTIYVSPRLGDIGQLLDLQVERPYPTDMVSDFERNRVHEAAKALMKYLQKHFGKGIVITLKEPALGDFLSEDDRDEVNLGEKGKKDLHTEILTELLIWVYYAASMATRDEVTTSVSTVKSAVINAETTNYIKIDLASVGDWQFIARTGAETDGHGDAIRGTAVFDGCPVRFHLFSRIFKYSIYLDELLPFVSPSLIEEVVNRAYNEVCVGKDQPFETILSEVVLDKPWNRL